MNWRARPFEAARATRRQVAVLGFVVALLIGVRFEPGAGATWTVSVARADDGASGDLDSSTRDRAKELLVQGVDLLKRAQYQAALERFDSAYALVPSPNIHYDRALAYLGLQRPADALAEFEVFLDDATHPPPGKREEAQRYQTDLRARVARLDASTVPSGAEIIVDGSSHGTTPLARSIYLDPGPHEISIRVSGAAGVVREPVNARAGQPVGVTVDLHLETPAIAVSGPAVAMPPAQRVNAADETLPPAASRRWLSSTGARTSALVATAAAVVLLGTGLTFGIMAQREGDSLTSDSRSATSIQPVRYDPNKQNNGKAYQRLEAILLGAGAVALTGGIVLYVFSRHRAAESSAFGKSVPERAGYALTGAPLLGPGLAGARLRIHF